MHVRLTTHPSKTITFTSPHGVVVTMPINVECTEPTELEFDLPALASISIVGEITSVTSGPNEPPCATCGHPCVDHDAWSAGMPCTFSGETCACEAYAGPTRG